MTSTDSATPVAAPEHPAPSRPGLVLFTAAASVFLLSLVQTLVVPVLPQIAGVLDVSSTTVGWVTTSTMLTASALTPLLGRLGDVIGHKQVILAALVVTLAGSLLAAVAQDITALIVGRVLQGASFGLFPIAISVLRAEMPRERLTGAMAVTASALGVGSGLALVAAGLLTRGEASYQRVFWFMVVFTVLVIVLAWFSLPSRPGRGGSVDWLGAGVLGLGLVALLLPISQGHLWGWGSPRVIGSFVVSALVLTAFLRLQAQRREPLVATSLLARRPVLATNLASMCIGFSMFSVFLGATYFVQSPEPLTGFGFDASVLRSSVEFMLPGAVVSVLMGPLAGVLVGRFGPRVVLLGSGLVGAAGLAQLAAFHDTAAVVIAGLIVGNAAIAMAYASMPALLVTHVAPEDTGIANSINSIMRTVGAAVGSAVVVTVLASNVTSHDLGGQVITVPSESAFVITFTLGAGSFVLAALLAGFGIGRGGRALTDTEIAEEEALGAAGGFATVSTDL